MDQGVARWGVELCHSSWSRDQKKLGHWFGVVSEMRIFLLTLFLVSLSACAELEYVKQGRHCEGKYSVVLCPTSLSVADTMDEVVSYKLNDRVLHVIDIINNQSGERQMESMAKMGLDDSDEIDQIKRIMCYEYAKCRWSKREYEKKVLPLINKL